MPFGWELFRDEAEKTRNEELNSRLQIDEALRLAEQMSGQFVLTKEIVKDLHQRAIVDIYRCAGEFRTWEVGIKGSAHKPPAWQTVEGLVEQMCEVANGNPGWDPIETAAYLLWRLNWIHPFGGGNGRTSRAVAYLALTVRLGFELPGELTIPAQLVANRRAYQEALEDADAAWRVDVLDVSRMRDLLGQFLKNQLRSVPDLG